MASLHPISVIAQQLVGGNNRQQYQRPAVTTRQPAQRPYAAPDQAVERVTARAKPSWASRFARVLVHPLSAVRSH